MFAKFAVLLATCGTVASDGDVAPPPAKPKIKTAEGTLRECKEVDRRVEASLKRTEELLRSLGMTLPKAEPVPPLNLLPNVPKK